MTILSEDNAYALDRTEEARGFWRSYVGGLVLLGLFAVTFGQFFKALEFTDDIGGAVLDRLLAVGVVSLFLERAIEVYIGASRRLGELAISEQIAEAKAERPDDGALQRQLTRQLSVYRLHTQQVAFLLSLFFGVLIASTGLRVLEGLITISDELRANPVWQTQVWWGLDIVLTGGMIGGGAAGIHELMKTFTAQFPQKAR
ncbi:MAG TPA: hypothetical protein VFR34_15725 [Paracoccaceae bacterium]|nr:hypothetical protein [Paracoccaceae bacterium]